jgi:hypothetical protein
VEIIENAILLSNSSHNKPFEPAINDW